MTIPTNARQQPPLSSVQRNKLFELGSAVYNLNDASACGDKLTQLAQTEFQAASLDDLTYEQAARLTGKLLSQLRSKSTSGSAAAQVAQPISANVSAPTATESAAANGSNGQNTASPAQPQAMQTVIQGEASFSWNSLARDENDWEEQFTVRAATGAELIHRVNALKAHLIKSGYKPITRRNNPPRGEANTPESEPAPLCAIHKTPMQKRSKDGRSWWSCVEKLDDGQWCQYRPKSK